MPRNDRTEGHRQLIQIMNSPASPEKVVAAAVKAVGALELTLMRLKLARYKTAPPARSRKRTTPVGSDFDATMRRNATK